MTAALSQVSIDRATLAPWWTEAKCHAHQPYKSPQAARRAAELHPISVRFCWKCADGYRIEAFRCHSAPSHWHIGHGTREVTPMIAPPLPPTIVPPKRGGGRPPKLTPQQAREIWVLCQRGVNRLEIARQYGVSQPTVCNIGTGHDWGWATTDLRVKQAEQETPVHITTPTRTIDLTTTTIDADAVTKAKREDDYQAMKDGLVARELETFIGAAPNLGQPRADTLVAELADAIEVLLEYRGKPLPKFVTLDVASIRRLVEQARGVE